MGSVKDISIKNRTYYFLMTWSISKKQYDSNSNSHESNVIKIGKKPYKTLIFIIFDTSQ